MSLIHEPFPFMVKSTIHCAMGCLVTKRRILGGHSGQVIFNKLVCYDEILGTDQYLAVALKYSKDVFS